MNTHQHLPLNDNTDYGLCFVCGPRNPWGLKLHFEREGLRVKSSFRAREAYQGFPGLLHGGIITALLDEVMSRVSLILENRWTMTVKMETQFRKPVHIGSQVTMFGEIDEANKRMPRVKGKLLLADGSVAATARGSFVYVPSTQLSQLASGYPKLAASWMK